MDNTLIVDLHIFLGSIYGGLVAGFVYDIYKTIRYYSNPSKLATYIEDLLFWIILALLFFYTSLKINWGELRGYIIIGFLCGVFVYKKVFSKVIYQLFLKIGGTIKNLIKKVAYVVTYPFRYLWRKIFKPIKKVKSIPKYFVKQLKKSKKIISTKK